VSIWSVAAVAEHANHSAKMEQFKWNITHSRDVSYLESLSRIDGEQLSGDYDIMILIMQQSGTIE
jgi:hypothetical protein